MNTTVLNDVNKLFKFREPIETLSGDKIIL